jgi:hypothetical protein
MSKRDSGNRKKAPAVDKEEDEVLPVGNDSSSPRAKSVPSARMKEAVVPEPKTWAQRLAYNKLQYGQKLIAWCIFLIIVLTLINYFWPRNSGAIGNTIELLKLVTTTALGFVFARTVDTEKGSDD